MRRAGLAVVLLAAPLLWGAAPPGLRKSPARPPSPPLDFSGVWDIDEGASVNVPRQMKGAVLSVTQKGNRIWISPLAAGDRGSMVMAEELVVDGRPYEKALGPAGKGTVTARWGDGNTSVWIDVRAGDGNDPKNTASQRSVWKLSRDGRVWVRETVSISQGTPRTARLVFRRRPAVANPTPTARPAPRRARTPGPARTP